MSRATPRQVAAVLFGIGLVAAGCGSSSSQASGPSTVPSVPTPSTTARPTPTPAAAADTACPTTAGTTVRTADQLTQALAAAGPGKTIVLAPGTYRGNFVAATSGTATAPITLCGPRAAILDGGDLSRGYVFYLSSANWWRVFGFTIQNGQKGVMTDHANHNLLAGLSVHTIGDEGIHLRSFSSDNTVRDNVVFDTGHLVAKFGEGIYVGSAHKNWCRYSACGPDKSDRNLIQGNIISHTAAENIDIKEGTTGGTITGNNLSGVGMNPSGASAWVNVKGNAWTVVGNNGVTSVKDGFQVHEVYAGWGYGNVFRSNHAAVNGPGYGYYVQHHSLQTVLACSNTATGAASGLSNIDCTNG